MATPGISDLPAGLGTLELSPGVLVPIDRQIDRYLKESTLLMDETGILYVAISIALSELKPDLISAKSPDHWQYHLVLASKAARDFGVVEVDTQVLLADEDIRRMDARANTERIFLTKLLDASKKARIWVVALAAGFQVRPLSAASILSYFQQFWAANITPQVLIPLIRCAARFLPSVVDNHPLRMALGTSSWMREHTEFSTTAGIILNMKDCLEAVGVVVVGPHTEELVRASFTNYWCQVTNGLIPKRLVGMAALWAEVNNLNYGDWTQGTAALAAMSPGQKAIWSKFFEKLMAVGGEISGIDESGNAYDLFWTIPQDMFFR